MREYMPKCVRRVNLPRGKVCQISSEGHCSWGTLCQIGQEGEYSRGRICQIPQKGQNAKNAMRESVPEGQYSRGRVFQKSQEGQYSRGRLFQISQEGNCSWGRLCQIFEGGEYAEGKYSKREKMPGGQRCWGGEYVLAENLLMTRVHLGSSAVQTIKSLLQVAWWGYFKGLFES